jgi:hypothetical protein
MPQKKLFLGIAIYYEALNDSLGSLSCPLLAFPTAIFDMVASTKYAETIERNVAAITSIKDSRLERWPSGFSAASSMSRTKALTLSSFLISVPETGVVYV